MHSTSSHAAYKKRCAIYLRKSSDKGLTQDFTSLQAQQEICSAYIASQRHKGWVQLPTVYEDSAVSGATLDRPAMRALIADIEKGLVDIVVVYKLDRLSRSLLDFIRLLETFDRHRVSFVCITQNFDTGDSLGRLVMNVLLTFAQFERELAADRIRDKKRLMTAKGMWSGGRPPLGYDLIRHRLVPNPHEAALVRHIFERYVELRSMKAVTRECRGAGQVSKVRINKDGARTGGCLLSIGTVRNILRNPIFAGQLKLGDTTCAGLHEAIVSRPLWEKAAAIRREQIKQRVLDAPEDLLGGITFDCFGRRMKPDRRYLRHGWVALYTSFQTDWARARRLKRLRVTARVFEQTVVSAVREFLGDRSRLRAMLIDTGHSALDRAAEGARMSCCLQSMNHAQQRCCLHTVIERIEVSRERILVQLRSTDVLRFLEWDGIGTFHKDPTRAHARFFKLDVPFVGVARLERRLRLPVAPNPARRKPNPRLVALIREAREAQALVDNYRRDAPDQLAARLNRTTGSFMKLLRLNYLAPDIVAAIHDGVQPATLRRKTLLNADLPLDWSLQRQLFDFPDQPPMRSSERY